MKRIAAAIGLTALAASAAAPAGAQDARDLARISAYLNGLTTAEGDFVQVAPDGSVSDGKFYISRPGRIRFEYTPPNPTLVVADGVWVVVFDLRDCSQQTAPLSETPLDLLLKERVNLRAEGAVTGVETAGGQMRVTAVDPDRPAEGQMTMVFSENPLELRQWIITDGQGQTTTVALSEVRRGVQISPAKFAPAAVKLDECKN
ncbi:outer membrane lipoprotein carrier protein LolA [Rhodovulum sp. DZ06]|uniref:outer membrane lipoprotein carrier protein LolA n=1 Tax=Rhodovulum sp. DZ06 TaxID=3425126 RepID=UPI003D32BEC8